MAWTKLSDVLSKLMEEIETTGRITVPPEKGKVG